MMHVVTLSKETLNGMFGRTRGCTIHDITNWCDANVVGGYHIHNIRTWIFKELEDAVMFKLRWL